MDDREKIVFDNLYARRSVRSYVEGKPVEREKIDKLLKAAMAAPSACNIQPWDFIVVTDEQKVSDIKASIKHWGDYNAPLIIVVCGDARFIPWDNDFGLIDCAAATENMLLAATAMGLGSVWIGGFDGDALRKILNIPTDIRPAAVVYFGYPESYPEPRTQYLEEAVHWNGYDDTRDKNKRPGCIV